MGKTIYKLLLLSTLLFLTSGCVHQEMFFPPESGTTTTAPATTDEQPTVDVSDLNNGVQAEGTVARIPFPVSEYSRLPRSGDATVKGQIYIVDATGRKIVGKQTRLYLNPVTSYSRQWYEQSYLGGRKMAKADPRLFNYLKFTSSDANGNFAFYGVPAGRYYLIGVVRCGQECGYDTPQNIRVAKEVSVAPGQTLQVDLSKSI